MVVRLYRDTGFNAVDIPDSPQMLEKNFSYFKQYANVNIQQINNLAYVTVELNEKYAREVDYVVFIDDTTAVNKNVSMYTVDGFMMLAPDVCKLQLREDAYNTLGGFSDPNMPYGPKTPSGNTILAGSANRLSVSVDEDNEVFYNAEEPFSPSKPSKIEFDNLLPLSGKTIKIVEVTALPPGYTINFFKPGEETPIDDNIIGKIIGGAKTIWRIATRPFSQHSIIIDNDGERQVNFVDTSSLKLRRINETTIRMTTPNEKEIYLKTGTSYFIIDDTGKYMDSEKANITYNLLTSEIIELKPEKHDLLMDMNEADMVDAIVGYWEVPMEYIQNYKIPGEKQYIAQSEKVNEEEPVMGASEVQAACYRKQLVASYPPNLYNNKAKYGQSFTITVYSPASGEKITKTIPELINDKPGAVYKEEDPETGEEITYNYKLQYAIVSDPRRGGSPLFMWRFVTSNSEQIDTPMEYIKGLSWRSVPLRVSGVTGELFDRMRMSQQKSNILFTGLGVALTGFKTVNTSVDIERSIPDPNAIPDLFTDEVPMINKTYHMTQEKLQIGNLNRLKLGGGMIAAGLWKISQQNDILNARGTSAGVNIQVGDSNYMRDINFNTFIQANARYDNLDLADFDTFLTRYGYNVCNRPLTNIDLYSRPGFNFVRVNDLSIQSVGGNSNLQNRVVNQLKNGVRLWHRPPNRQDMLAGGNR